jgi:hypothetical protein
MDSMVKDLLQRVVTFIQRMWRAWRAWKIRRANQVSFSVFVTFEQEGRRERITFTDPNPDLWNLYEYVSDTFDYVISSLILCDENGTDFTSYDDSRLLLRNLLQNEAELTLRIHIDDDQVPLPPTREKPTQKPTF